MWLKELIEQYSFMTRVVIVCFLFQNFSWLFRLVLTTFISSLTLALGCLYAAREMHSLLLGNVLRFPMSKFDTTPLGRILNLCSKDVDVCDNVLPAILRGCLMTFFSVRKFLFNEKTYFSSKLITMLNYLRLYTPPFLGHFWIQKQKILIFLQQNLWNRSLKHLSSSFNWYFLWYFIPKSVFCTVLSTLLFYLGGLGAAKYLHEQLLGNVLRAPMTKFFDIVPIGRIINRYFICVLKRKMHWGSLILLTMMNITYNFNRFSKDVDSADTIIPPTIRAFFTCFFSVRIVTFLLISVDKS